MSGGSSGAWINTLSALVTIGLRLNRVTYLVYCNSIRKRVEAVGLRGFEGRGRKGDL